MGCYSHVYIGIFFFVGLELYYYDFLWSRKCCVIEQMTPDFDNNLGDGGDSPQNSLMNIMGEKAKPNMS